MSAAAKKEPGNESDHHLNTLTDVVRIVGETRSDVKVIDRKVDCNQQENRERFDRLEQKVDRLEQKVDQQSSDLSEVKEMLQVLLSRQ